MLRNKKGMMLGEILITISIMAFIAMIAIMTVKPFEKAMRSLYSRAFEALQNASYNAYVDNASTEFFQTPKDLCEGLIEYMNTYKKEKGVYWQHLICQYDCEFDTLHDWM